jgi:hypothetical protein
MRPHKKQTGYNLLSCGVKAEVKKGEVKSVTKVTSNIVRCWLENGKFQRYIYSTDGWTSVIEINDNNDYELHTFSNGVQVVYKVVPTPVYNRIEVKKYGVAIRKKLIC